MKQCQKWWNGEQTNETQEEFLAKHGGLTTQEQVMDVLVEMVWREALEWFKSEIDRCHAGNDVIDMIFEDELKDD